MSKAKQVFSEIDAIDRKILDLLVENARISITEMSEIVGPFEDPMYAAPAAPDQ
jgi:Lrp/AsnC family leucine-responsive transcriptional regulator